MLRVAKLNKHFYRKSGCITVLCGIDLDIRRGEICSIAGASGSGKTTLMNVIGLLDRQYSGSVCIDGVDTLQLTDSETAVLRNRLIGFVFQSFHLLPRLSALDNVALPLVYRGIAETTRRSLAEAALERVGLAARAAHHPDEMSGGQRQRVAIARALVGNPMLLLADEPTGNLDSQAADDIMTLFLALNRDLGVTVLIVTHDPAIAARCLRRIVMRDGRILDDKRDGLRDAVCLP